MTSLDGFSPARFQSNAPPDDSAPTASVNSSVPALVSRIELSYVNRQIPEAEPARVSLRLRST